MSAFHDPEIYRGILESLPTGLCIVDMQKRIVLWSDGAERITGHLRYDVIGHCCVGEPLLHCDQQDCEWCHEDCPLARAMKTAQATEALGFLHHKAGYEIPVSMRAAPVHNAHGSIVGAVEIFEDQQQSALANHRDDALHLAGYVDEVTGVASHAMMQSHLREMLGTFAEVHVPFGVLGLRLEGLDDFRARYGLEAVASLLRVIGRTLEGSLWKTDIVGRWSDDQFLVLVNGCSDEALRSVGERVRHLLSSNGIEWWGERRSLPVSIGQAAAQPGDTIELLMERMQKSLHAAWAMRGRAAGSGNQTSES
ncbi:MAG: diguanylate cyclase domain-containing protein [Candidatus Sulfotelmatobacter sp.]